MPFNPFKAVKEGSRTADRIIREEIDDPRQWEAELNGQPSSEDQQR